MTKIEENKKKDKKKDGGNCENWRKITKMTYIAKKNGKKK